MHLAPTERQQRLRTELRSYFAALMAGSGGRGGSGGGGGSRRDDPDEQRRLLRQIGADSLLGLGWPVAYGGQGRGPDEQFVFFDEAYRAGAPVSMVTLNTVGPTLMRYGTEEQKAYFLPRILSGELVFAIGYSEPEAGTDLAALRTRAVRDGDGDGDRGEGGDGGGDGGGEGHWVIDGQKIFTSNAQQADWIWLACRTDPDAPKHRGISIILVPTDDPGFSWTPIETVGGLTTTATYYDGVRVPASNLVGEENGGWKLITSQLNHERVALAAIGMQAEDFYEEALAHVRTPDPATGRRRIDEPWVRARLAEAYARLAATRLLNWRLVGAVGAGALAPGEASGVKFAGTESAVEVYRMCQEVVGEAALLRGGSPGCFGADGSSSGGGGGAVRGGGELERMNRAAQINTFGGGVSEVQREIVATMRLGMTRGKR
ncbi:acyl-CoA dehydrogenase family protein [Streptomyces griseus]|uniref:Acyl-CoA dehydrogenase family protein n=2 Tax=Streptomyces TaxID=1883 RepID=A0ABU2WA86_9ACTN|nr:acyl-CoA dehydrogenase family protein [Streptomyces griseus]MDT0494793.1 acyl-CoA dehydrogenase family protein [Streptomyces griseus]